MFLIWSFTYWNYINSFRIHKKVEWSKKCLMFWQTCMWSTQTVKKERNQYFPPRKLWACCSTVTLSPWTFLQERSSNTWTHPDSGPRIAIKHARPYPCLCFRSTVEKDFCTLFNYFLSSAQVPQAVYDGWKRNTERAHKNQGASGFL